MPRYLGNVPIDRYLGLTQQSFTSPTGTSFVLTHSVTNSIDLALFINNTRQEPSTYTASGTSLTLSEALISGDEMYCLYNGRTTGTKTAAPGTITEAMLHSDIVIGGPSLGTSSVIRTNAKTISENITFAGTENGMSAGPVTVANGFTVTVTAGSTWTII